MRRIATIFVSLVSAGVLLGAATPPGKAQFTFPRSTPEAQGISSKALLDFVNEAEQKIDALHSFMLVRHGKVVAEGWWSPYAANEPHSMFSLSKSFTSTAVGLAIAEGKFTLDDSVVSFFPDKAPENPSANLQAMRVRDLLTMTAGHHDEAIKGFPFDADVDLVKTFLAIPVAHKPGTFFVYNTPASYMLSAIVQTTTGMTVIDCLRPRLFEPLGIQNPVWDASKQGISLGGYGLWLVTEDIARFGQLYLQKGRWQGRQLVPASWVEAATSRQVSNGSSPASDWEQGYGYQFWRARHGFYRGDGAHGQFCLVLPQYDTVVAITSGTRDMASVMNLVWDRIVPALKSAPLAPDAGGNRALKEKLASLSLAAPSPASGAHLTADAVGKRYVFPDNALHLEWLAMDALAPSGEATFTARIGGHDERITATPGAWHKGTLTVAGKEEPIAVSGAWTADDTYTMKVARYRTPFVTTYTMRFDGDQLKVDSEVNVGAPETRTAQFVGKAAAQPAGSKD